MNLKRLTTGSIIKILAILTPVLLMSCEKDNLGFKNDEIPVYEQEGLSGHKTCTELIETNNGEVLVSMLLSSSPETTDAVIYYSTDNMDFNKSAYLTAGLNILNRPIDEGPACKGIKAALPSVNIVDKTERTYYFKIVRENDETKVVHFGFELRSCGTYRISDSNSANRAQDFIYYIKADENGNPSYINIKFY